MGVGFRRREDLQGYDVVFLGDVGVTKGMLSPEQATLLRGLIEQQASGLVFLPGRPPYAIAILTESPGGAADRSAALTAVSRVVYDAVAAAGEAACP